MLCHPIFRVKGNFVGYAQVSPGLGRFIDEGFDFLFLELRYVLYYRPSAEYKGK
jgi:hypothetical protein